MPYVLKKNMKTDFSRKLQARKQKSKIFKVLKKTNY